MMLSLAVRLLTVVVHAVLGVAFALLDRGFLPDVITRFGVRHLLQTERLDIVKRLGVEKVQEQEERFIQELRRYKTIAVETEKANEQHYEVPTEFFRLCLGPRLKYSSCEWRPGCKTLAEAENHTFETYAQRAQLEDGMSILDLGCGWGSLSLWLLEHFPKSTVYSVSNSNSQREFIEAAAANRGWSNRLTVYTANINTFELPVKVERIMSVEMLEHCRNYELVFSRLSSWLKEGGKVFVHIFTFEHHSYHFEAKDETDWMALHFFSGGTMPSHELFERFPAHLRIVSKWKSNGCNYSKTLESWLQNMDANTPEVKRLFGATYGRGNAQLWISRWRAFYMACSELFRFGGGNVWYVSHYLFEKSGSA